MVIKSQNWCYLFICYFSEKCRKSNENWIYRPSWKRHEMTSRERWRHTTRAVPQWLRTGKNVLTAYVRKCNGAQNPGPMNFLKKEPPKHFYRTIPECGRDELRPLHCPLQEFKPGARRGEESICCEPRIESLPTHPKSPELSLITRVASELVLDTMR